MAIVTISRELGSSGTYIALKVAKELGCTCYDQQVIHEIAQKLGKNQDQIADFDQDTYSRVGVFFQEALNSIAHGGLVFHPFGIGPLDWDSSEIFSAYPRDFFCQKDYIDILTQVIKEIANNKNAVILGRGACHILKDYKDYENIRHYRIVANKKDRIERLCKEQKIEADQAQKLIEAKDKAASSFVYDFFNVDWNDPHFYHLVLNTSLCDPDLCIKIILHHLNRD